MFDELAPSEAWAWGQIRAGTVADFNAHFDKTLDPSDPEGWGDNRKLGAGFLRRIFFEPTYRDEIPVEGVRIVGAFLPDGQILRAVRLDKHVSLERCLSEKTIDFEGLQTESFLSVDGSRVVATTDPASINLAGAHVEKELSLGKGATFEGDVILVGAKIDGQLILMGSTFEQIVNANGLRVGQGLFMNKGTTFKGEVVLATAKIGGLLTMRGATFSQKLEATSLQVGGDLLMDEEATFDGDVNLLSAKIGGHLSMVGSIFGKSVAVTGAQVGQSLLLHNGATFKGDVNLVGTKIEHNFSMDHTTFDGMVNADSLRVGEHLFIRHAIFRKPTSLIFARVGGNLDLRGTTFVNLDLTGTTIAKDLRLAGQGSTVKWDAPGQDNAAFKLRNVQVGALQDSPDSWPFAIDLEGFSYGHVGGLGAAGTDDARNRSVADWTAWLKKSSPYGPQPYVQLANVLIAAGRRDHADAIRFAGRERERSEAWRQRRWRQWLWLTVLSSIYCYGIGLYTFRVLWWIAGSVLAGTAVLWIWAPIARAKGLLWCVGASLDRLLPIVQLNKEFSDFFFDPGRVRLDGFVIGSFAALGLWGWFLGLLLIGAVSGLTKKS